MKTALAEVPDEGRSNPPRRAGYEPFSNTVVEANPVTMGTQKSGMQENPFCTDRDENQHHGL
jgi:hypothetical protein